MTSVRDTPLPIAALIGGGGRTLMNIADHIDRGEVNAKIVVVIATTFAKVGIERARQRGLTVHVVDDHDGESATPKSGQIDRWIDESGAELVCLCGWMRWFRVSEKLVGRVVNIHPALLPSFGGQGMYGMAVHRAVLAAGEKESGCTVHFVDGEYDHGPIITQRRCPVRAGDTAELLAKRVFAEECLAYPTVISEFADGLVRYDRGRAVREHSAR